MIVVEEAPLVIAFVTDPPPPDVAKALDDYVRRRPGPATQPLAHFGLVSGEEYLFAAEPVEGEADFDAVAVIIKIEQSGERVRLLGRVRHERFELLLDLFSAWNAEHPTTGDQGPQLRVVAFVGTSDA